MEGQRTYVETEIKLRWDLGAEAAVQMLEQHGYRLLEPRTLEVDQLFDRETGELRSSARLLRLRLAGSQAIVTFKGPPAGGPHKSREEIEFSVSDAGTFTQVLDRLGYNPTFRYEKYRTKFSIPGEPGFITLDETPIGIFLELEGEPQWIDRTAARLDFKPDAYLTASYAALYREYRQLNPGVSVNMVFPGTNTL